MFEVCPSKLWMLTFIVFCFQNMYTLFICLSSVRICTYLTIKIIPTVLPRYLHPVVGNAADILASFTGCKCTLLLLWEKIIVEGSYYQIISHEQIYVKIRPHTKCQLIVIWEVSSNPYYWVAGWVGGWLDGWLDGWSVARKLNIKRHILTKPTWCLLISFDLLLHALHTPPPLPQPTSSPGDASVDRESPAG